MQYRARATCGLAAVVALAMACSDDTRSITKPAEIAETLAVSFDATHDSIPLGESRSFSAKITNQFGQLRAGQVLFAVSNPTVASVTVRGEVTGLAPGRTQLIAAIAGASDTVEFTVLPPTLALDVSPRLVLIPEGDTVQFSAAARSTLTGKTAGLPADAEWIVSDSSIATIDDEGRLIAMDSGSATVVLQSQYAQATATISVERATVASVTVNPSTTTIALGGNAMLQARAYDATGRRITRTDVTWSSSNPSIVRVAANGQVTGLVQGFASISATIEGVTGTAVVNVSPAPVATIRVTLRDTMIVVGGTTRGTAVAYDANGTVVSGSSFTWQSSAPAVATVAGDGTITAIAAGTSTISAVSGGKVGSARLSVVTRTPSSLAIVPNAPSVSIGSTTQLVGEVRDQFGAAMTGYTPVWSSSSSSVATVSPAGVLTGSALGVTNVTAQVAGLSATVQASVTQVPVASLRISPSPVSVPAQGQIQVTGTTLDSNGNVLTGRPVTWTSASPTIATVTGSGLVSGIAMGTTTITASSEGKSVSATVNVTQAVVPPSTPTTVTVALSSGQVSVGQKTQASASVYDQNGARITNPSVAWSSANTAVATVDATGMVTAVAAGTVSIIATSGSVSGGAALTVAAPAPAPVSTIAVAINPSQIAPSATATATATLYDSVGNVLTGRTIAWNSSDVTIATISANGTVTGVSNGAAEMRATSGTATGVRAVSVASGTVNPVPATVTVTPSPVSVVAGATAQLACNVREASGAPVSGSITWSSSNSTVASVSALGVVTAVAAGSATITCTAYNGVKGTSVVSVSTPTQSASVETVSVTLNAASLTAGQSTSAVAVARDASGNVISGTSFVFSSSNTAVATVSQVGQVSAIGAGSATITATASGKSGSSGLTVTAPAPTGTTIPLVLKRYDGGSGAVLVANGIPLVAGALFPSQLRNFRILVNGVEQSVYAEAPTSLHADGSLRSVFVAFNYSVPSTGAASGSLVVGQSRGTTDIAAPSANRSNVRAYALPSDPVYMVQTGINGPTITSADARASGGAYQRYETDFATYAEQNWTRDGEAWANANYYDRALIYYAMWARTGNPDYFYRAGRIAVNYRINYLEANAYGTSPHWAQMEGLEQHYLLAGDPASKTAVARVAEVLSTYPIADTLNTNWMESRIQARVLQSLFLAWRINAVGPENLSLPSRIDKAIDDILKTQRSNGSFGFPNTCYYSLNYMNGLLNDAFIKVYTYYRADSRLFNSVKKSVDYFWQYEWLSSYSAFKYITQNCTSTASGTVGGPTPEVDLNNLFVTGFSWIYSRTGDASYKTKADQIFASAVNGAYISGSKQFNQQYTASFRYLAYRR